jgi:hypothetical protein
MDIWFGPGALRGVFGAGVAWALQRAIDDGRLDPRRLRLYGSSVGCLNALYLATGNADCGLDVYREDVAQLIHPRRLLPSMTVRAGNRLRAALGRGPRRVPPVLDVEHVFAVMRRRTPHIAEQLRESPTAVFAELLDRRSGQYRHQHLQSAADPLQIVRHALHCFPFAYLDDRDSLDSGIGGYGFPQLLETSATPLAIVLNEPPGAWFSGHVSGILSAAIAASPSVSRLYLRRQAACVRAVALARKKPADVLLLHPARPVQRNPRGFLDAHAEGRQAAERILAFGS